MNLDPANDSTGHDWDIDIKELITVEDIMIELKLGPNGGLIYAIEFLEVNLEWLICKIQEKTYKTTLNGDAMMVAPFFIFDLPGQVELYSNYSSMSNIVKRLQKELSFNLVAVHLTDSQCIMNTSKFLGNIFQGLTAMLQTEMPFIHVMSKCNLLPRYGEPKFRFNTYTDCDWFEYLLEAEEYEEKRRVGKDKLGGFWTWHHKLNKAVAELLSQYSKVQFVPLDIEEHWSMAYLIGLADWSVSFNLSILFLSSEIEKRIDYSSILEYMSYNAASEIQEKYLDIND